MKRYEIIPQIVGAIAEVEGCSQHDLEYSLYDYIDTTAIRLLWESETTDWELTFQVPDHTVTLRGDGQIRVDGEVVQNATESTVQN